MFRVLVNYKYSAGHYKKIPYWFKTEEEYKKWFDKENSDQGVRKIIGLEKETK